MRRSQIALLGLLAFAAALVGVLALRTRQPPWIPRDAVHRPGDPVDDCLDCHGPNGTLPRSKNHPIGQDCFRCHAFR